MTQLDIFPKEDRLMANRHMERCPTSLIIRDIQLKATMSYDITSVRTSIIRNANNNYWQGCGEKRIIMIVGGNVSWHRHWGKHIVIAQKIKSITTKNPAIPILGAYLKKMKTLTGKDICIPVLTAALFTIAKIWKQLKCHWFDEWIQMDINAQWDISYIKEETQPFAVTT